MTLPYRRALITGVSGQDGALLAAELLRAGVVVTGTHRPRSDFWRLRELGIANDPSLEIVWSARGGYGAIRLLPLLDELTERHGVPPRKLLVGYSDSTALLEYARERWGWETLHAPMPGLRKFGAISGKEWSSLMAWLRGEAAAPAWGKLRASAAGAGWPRRSRSRRRGGADRWPTPPAACPAA